MDLSILTNPETWIALLTLTALEIVLGIDNIVFISIMAGKLPPEQRAQAYRLGLGAALIMRIALLFSTSFIVGLTAPLFTLPFLDREVSGRDLILFGITWVMGLTRPLFSMWGQAVSGRDLILGLGGLFLIGKSTHEIYAKLEVEDDDDATRMGGHPSLAFTIAQILLLDIVFSLDSVITAVGMAQEILVMVIAMVIAVGIMLVFAGKIGDFVNRHPSMKILALAFLLLIGVMLVAESLDQHVEKGYIYFAMSFSLAVELLNMRFRKKRQRPVALHEHKP
ncbi:MAG TPA: TerC family protein [Kofleriaceae bacterium]